MPPTVLPESGNPLYVPCLSSPHTHHQHQHQPLSSSYNEPKKEALGDLS